MLSIKKLDWLQMTHFKIPFDNNYSYYLTVNSFSFRVYSKRNIKPFVFHGLIKHPLTDRQFNNKKWQLQTVKVYLQNFRFKKQTKKRYQLILKFQSFKAADEFIGM